MQAMNDAVDALELGWLIAVSEFLEVPYLVLTTDLIGYNAKSTSQTPLQSGLLQAIRMPMPQIAISFMLWHETRRSDEGHHWLRDLVARR